MSDNIAEINRKLSVFRYCQVLRSDLEVFMGVIKPAEFNCAIIFKTLSRTSGKNRKLSVFRYFKAIRSNFPVKTDIIRDAESDDVISFDLCPRTSGLIL